MPSFFLDAAKPFYDVLRVSPLVGSIEVFCTIIYIYYIYIYIYINNLQIIYNIYNKYNNYIYIYVYIY